jgi:hypothetical protein
VIALLAAAAIALAPAPCEASGDPDQYILVPGVEQGEVEVELRMGAQNQPGVGTLEATSIALGYGVNSWWFTEGYAKFQRPCGGSVIYDAFEWENRFQLLEPGAHWLDLGVVAEFEAPADRSEGYEILIGPLTQKSFGPWQLNMNVLFEGRIDAASGGATELGYQWQLKYRWKPKLEFGVQALGDVGPWNAWEPASEQPHLLGPAIFGRLPLGSRERLHYDMALLFGLTSASPDARFRLQVEFEF